MNEVAERFNKLSDPEVLTEYLKDIADVAINASIIVSETLPTLVKDGVVDNVIEKLSPIWAKQYSIIADFAVKLDKLAEESEDSVEDLILYIDESKLKFATRHPKRTLKALAAKSRISKAFERLKSL